MYYYFVWKSKWNKRYVSLSTCSKSQNETPRFSKQRMCRKSTKDISHVGRSGGTRDFREDTVIQFLHDKKGIISKAAVFWARFWWGSHCAGWTRNYFGVGHIASVWCSYEHISPEPHNLEQWLSLLLEVRCTPPSVEFSLQKFSVTHLMNLCVQVPYHIPATTFAPNTGVIMEVNRVRGTCQAGIYIALRVGIPSIPKSLTRQEKFKLKLTMHYTMSASASCSF